MIKPTVLDLFAGAGGFSLGFQWAGYATLAAIDNDPFAIETLEANFGHRGTRALACDLGTVSARSLLALLKSEGLPTSFDAIIAGPPCQGWSKVGRGKLRSLLPDGLRDQPIEDPRNKLYRRFLDYVALLQPRVAVMENVPGMLSHDGANIAAVVARNLEAIGYSVSWKLLNTRHYGVPQVRERLFFVGVRKDLQLSFEFPAWQTKRGGRVYPDVTVRDAIGDLPRIRNGAKTWVRDYRPPKRLSAYAQRMRRGAADTVFDHVCRTHNDQDLEAFRLLKQGGWYRDLPARLRRYRADIFEDKYKKLFWDQPSWCVTAHLSKDCYTHIHPSQARTISVREAARLQSFPDSFYFAGNMGTKFRLIGNAVPPLLAERIAVAIRKQILDRAPLRSGLNAPAGASAPTATHEACRA